MALTTGNGVFDHSREKLVESAKLFEKIAPHCQTEQHRENLTKAAQTLGTVLEQVNFSSILMITLVR